MGQEGTRITRAFPIVVSGPSGVGKTTLVDRIAATDPLLRTSVSMTTRPPRQGEVEGESYFFVQRAEFEGLKAAGLIEWAEVHGYLYGTPQEFVDNELAQGRDVVLNIDVQGGAEVKKRFAEAVMVFILPPSLKVLEERIRQRGTDYAKEIEKRLENARGEIRRSKEYDYFVVNDTLDRAVSALRAIIESERCRRTRYRDDFLARLETES